MKDFKKTFLPFKDRIWQFSFLIILIPFIYLNQINEMPLMQKQNFNEHIYLYLMSLMKLVDNGANLVKYFYVVFFSALVVISFYFKMKYMISIVVLIMIWKMHLYLENIPVKIKNVF